jgi:saccharopine dehydrogenase-like NADP-dependent oxidoreductase
MEKGQLQSVSYPSLFKTIQTFQIQGSFYEGYPNRNSRIYQQLYGLEHVQTFVRGTLRYPGFCAGWDYLVQLGVTDDVVLLPAQERTTASFFQPYLTQIPPNETQRMFVEALGAFENIPLTNQSVTAAVIVQQIIELQWALQPNEYDRVVMLHELIYKKDHQRYKKTISLIVDGTPTFTAMAQLVGLPLALAVEMHLLHSFTLRGVQRPLDKQFYVPLLKRLSELGVRFEEQEEVL